MNQALVAFGVSFATSEAWNKKNPDNAIQVNDILISVKLGEKPRRPLLLETL